MRGASPPCSCKVGITPNPLELYVSEPNKTLEAVDANPAGGTFTWTSSDPSKLTISGTGSKVTVQGLDEGDVTVTVKYSPPTCAPCSAQATVKVRYEVRHILVAQGIQFNNSDLASGPGIYQKGDLQIPTGYLNDLLSTATPFPLQVSGTSATFKSVKQGVKYIIQVTTDKTEFKNKLETPGTGPPELDYWHVIYAGHSRYGRGACFGTSQAPGEAWENGATKPVFPGNEGLYRMGYPWVGVPVSDILHHLYSTDVVSHKVHPVTKTYPDLESKVTIRPTTLKRLKSRSEQELLSMQSKKRATPPANWSWRHQKKLNDLQQLVDHFSVLESNLRIVGDAKPLVQIGDRMGSDDQFWCSESEEGPAVMLQAGWKDTVSKPMDLGATNLQCRVFCHFGCSSYFHFRSILRHRKNWKKKGNKDRFAYFNNRTEYNVENSFWLYHLLTFSKFNAGLPWEESLEYARKKTNKDLSNWCSSHGVRTYQIW